MNTIIVPSKPDGLNYFLSNSYWENIRLGDKKISELKYIALYQSAPVCSITHYGVIEKIEKYEVYSYRGSTKYRIYFKLISDNLNIKLDDASNRKLIIQSPRYVEIKALLKATTLSELFRK